ncbi:MAG: NAD(P)-dependent alcohol dehydrogenase [Myxococcales bacterium]|nr:MAG: NAD(P)-dependent alcohol dehydrogenase [Myxococcales bacterium]
MRAWQINKNFGLDNFQLVERTDLRLEPHQVRIKTKACSLNFRDLMVIKGAYNPKQPLPLVPVSDGAGEIVEVGSLVKNFKVGDKVCGTFSQNWDYGRVGEFAQKFTLGSPIDGMLSESVVLSEQGIVKYPSFLSFQEAATLPCAALTAFNAMTQESDFKAGDTILIEGTGGVSLFALQFAKRLAINSIVISSSDEKLEKVRELGASHTINYLKDKDWDKQVLSLTNDQGVDGVIEVGGAKTINKALACVKRGGFIGVIGILSGTSLDFDLIPILMRQIRVHGIFVGSKSMFVAMNRVIEHSKLHPVIDKEFSFLEAPLAFHYMESGAHFGKIVINME